MQAVPDESPICQGMVFAVAQLTVSRKNCLDSQGMQAYTAVPTATYKPIRITEGATG